ncbi:MAG: hypothetical protein AAF447_23975 [Myxococcota bacterium]
MHRTLLVLPLVLLLACGDDDGTATATSMDMTTGGTNALGQLCGDGEPDCPADHGCVVFSLIGGSATQGYCSPLCENDADCNEGFAGPGSASCFRSPECAISCTTPMSPGECPAGLTCLPTGGPTSACGVPE